MSDPVHDVASALLDAVMPRLAQSAALALRGALSAGESLAVVLDALEAASSGGVELPAAIRAGIDRCVLADPGLDDEDRAAIREDLDRIAWRPAA